MKKENYGIPAMPLCVAIYLIGIASVVGTFWPILAVTVAVFALQFDSRVKKTAVQALGLALIIAAIGLVFDLVGSFKGLVDTYATYRDDSGYTKFMNTLEYLVRLAAYILYGILMICSAIGSDIFVGKAHLVVDGFVPAKPVQPMYNGGQPMNGAQAMNVGQQPMNGGQMYGAPQQGQFNGQQPQQPQQFGGGQFNPNNNQPNNRQ